MISRRGFCVLLPGAVGYLSRKAHGLPLHDVATLSAGNSNETWSFASPPEAARPYVLWMWMGSNVSAPGITKDLEAMKEAGIGGATIFSLADSCVPWAGLIAKSPTPDVVAFREPWWNLIRHAAVEAHRLGLELILHNCAGYESSGGPWITPELSMQEVVWSETQVQGGNPYRGVLPRATVDPHPHAQFPKVYVPHLGRIDIPIVEARKTYYRDIAVLAVPTEGVIAKQKTVMLSARMSAAGELEWDAPAGAWTIYRFGHTTTGAMIQPAHWDAMGLECDKMSKQAVTFHVQHVLGEMKNHLGDLMGKGITTLYFDSYEAGIPTWTPRMREEFMERRGYDLLTWLPVLAGRKVEDDSQTERFKEDFKRTTYDLYRDCYWATSGPLAHQAGVKLAAEPYEGPWGIGEVVKFLDLPTVEFWTHENRYSPVAVEPVVNAAHSMGAKLIGAEAFTTAPELAHWNEHPAWLKPIGDAAFCEGINRMNLHHFVHQPWDEKYKPGNTMGQWGVHFGRNQTWWQPGKAWLMYLWRCQNLLQRGEFVPSSSTTSVAFNEVTAGSEGGKAKPEFKSIHRRIGEASVFFIANVARVAGTVRIGFPVTGKQPEMWDPVWGTMRDLPSFTQRNGVTELQSEFAAAQSLFFVFRAPAQGSGSGSNSARYRSVATIDGSWRVSFDPAWGGPGSIILPALIDWTLHEHPGVRYYSGTAVYRTTIDCKEDHASKRVLLDVGECNHLADITWNGRRLGVLWTAPWCIDITEAIRNGPNEVEIAVTNVWANRLIGDEQQPQDCIWEVGDLEVASGEFLKEFPEWFLQGKSRPSQKRLTFTTWNYFHQNSPLTPSGLLGPVRLLVEQ